MRKNFGTHASIYPQPVFILAAYGEDGTACAMNAAWGGISDDKELSFCVSPPPIRRCCAPYGRGCWPSCKELPCPEEKTI